MRRHHTGLFEQAEFIDKDDLKEEIRSFHAFAFKKNMLQLSIAMILGAAFNEVVGSISQNLVMPVINAVLSRTGNEWREAIWQPTQNIAIEYGAFLGAFVDFLLTALILYLIFKKVIIPLWSKYIPQEEEGKEPPAPPPPVPISFPGK